MRALDNVHAPSNPTKYSTAKIEISPSFRNFMEKKLLDWSTRWHLQFEVSYMEPQAKKGRLTLTCRAALLAGS